ncbi:MAG: response regulator [Desulfobulbaceae bacterium]|nr:response regulator [Desulfobulbaceae bacterium]
MPKKLKILIAEDNPLTQKLYRVGLSDSVFDKQIVDNGQIAFELYEQWHPDIVLTDIVMPEMNGFQLLHKIRISGKDKKTTIIVATSSTDRKDVLACMKIGVQGYIIKPFLSSEISDAILKNYKKKKAAKAKLKVEYLNPFLVSAQKTIETMAQIPVRTRPLQRKEERVTYGEVTGIIGMSSEKVSGNMVISFSKSCILDIVAKMFMEPEKDEIDKDVVDAVGELTNIICGGAKAKLAKHKILFDMATPTMIVGKNIQLHYRPDAEIIVIPFETPSGNFVVEANLGVSK